MKNWRNQDLNSRHRSCKAAVFTTEPRVEEKFFRKTIFQKKLKNEKLPEPGFELNS